MTDLEAAGILPRLFAWLVDRVILASFWALVACWGLVADLSWTRWPPGVLDVAALLGVLVLWGIGLDAAYFTVFVGGCGQTPGKMLLGIAVVRRDGAGPGYGRALLRWMGSWASTLPLGLGFVPALFTADHRGLHDWMAGTRVVRQIAPAYAFKEVSDEPTAVFRA